MQGPALDTATLVLVGHGATNNAGSLVPLQQTARALQTRQVFGQVIEAFYKAEPSLPTVWNRVRHPTVFVAPVTISDGYFTTEVIPSLLGLSPNRRSGFPYVQKLGQRLVYGCAALGSHPRMTDLVIQRAEGILRDHPAEPPPRLADTALFLAGHGTPRNHRSRIAVEHQADRIAHRRLFAEVHPAFMLESPYIADCWQATTCADLVMVPYFMGDGLHTQEDIPILLGAAETEVRQRLAAGRAPWANPTRRGTRQRLWYTSAVGAGGSLADLVLERVCEAQALPRPAATA